MSDEVPVSNHPIWLYGHRGAAAEFPENTLPSFKRAVEVGVDVIETDVHMSRDGVIVVAHDPTGGRTASTAAEIRDTVFRDIQKWDAGFGFVLASGERPFAASKIRMPSLEETLTTFPDTRFNLDLKQESPSMVGPLLALINRLDASQRITIGSFHRRVMAEVRTRGFRGMVAAGVRDVLALRLAPDIVTRRLFRPVLLKPRALQIPPKSGPLDLSQRHFIDRAHRFGFRVDYWTINRVRDAEVLLDRGADGIITDDPARLADVVRLAAHARSSQPRP